MTSIHPVLLLATVAAIACAPAAGTGERRSSNVITRQQIVDSQVSNAHDVISRLRPTFLRSRGRTTISSGAPEYPEVYLDGQRYGEIESLKTLIVDNIKEIRFLNAADATTKYGTGHTAGIIEIVTR